MKIPKKWELQQIAFNHSSYTDFKDKIFIKRYFKAIFFYSYWCYSCRCYTDNPLKNLSERIQKLIMVVDYKIRDEKLQYDINRESVKISVWSSGKTDEYEYVTGE